jgi:signal transduction histidine kinase
MLPIEEPNSMEPLVDSAADALLPLEQLVLGGRRPVEDDAAIAFARVRAAALRASSEDHANTDLLAVTFVADLLGRLWLERRWSSDKIDRLVRRLAVLLDRPEEPLRMSLYFRLVRDQQLYELPPKLAIEAQLQMLTAFGPLTEPSLWLTDATSGKLVCPLYLGEGDPGRRSRAAAAGTMDKNDVTTSERALIHAAPVRRWNQPVGALVARSRGEGRRDALTYLGEAALALAPLIEIDNLLERNASHERALVESSERRLVRLGFDLHDGPMQDIAALAQDVRFFRAQLEAHLVSGLAADRLLGRVDDLEARLVALDRDLRALAQTLDAPVLSRMRFSDALAHVVGEFERRTGVKVELSESGDFSDMTPSQRIALLRVVQEALNNAHEHGGTAKARVATTAGRQGVSAQVYDEGGGFAVEERLVQAAKAGHLGLVGMSERVRLLGGKLEIDSKPGGPTRISARIPRWQPLASS